MNPYTEPDAGTSDPEETIPHLGESLARIDPDLGNPTRLGLVASLKNRERAEFKAAARFPRSLRLRPLPAHHRPREGGTRLRRQGLRRQTTPHVGLDHGGRGAPPRRTRRSPAGARRRITTQAARFRRPSRNGSAIDGRAVRAFHASARRRTISVIQMGAKGEVQFGGVG